ncbi:MULTISPECIES: DUF4010 domain-containing protein [Comamonas]|uniref:MgtC/SapB family protein n=1 Tax=Comamonas TaxID=283 RepID=UPI0001DA61FF|nr:MULTISPECIES: DUF4010 domain-containing protein [Comamonas]EFI60497.1 putative transmembrane protein [Comamonas thiooxydans]TFF54946.1 DUF4010 domain-containing protein [Comamonas sp. A23]
MQLSWAGVDHWVVSLGCGLLIGLVSERRGSEHESIAGTRTHAIAALLGCAAWWLGVLPFAVVLLLVGALTVAAYWHSAPNDPGLTSEVTLLFSLTLGALSHKSPTLTAALGILCALLVHSKGSIQRWSRELLRENELRDGLLLGAAALVVMPLLPQAPIDPWGVLSLAALWKVVVLFMAVGMLGHILTRVLGPRWGLPVTGFFSGFVSSTAAIASLGQLAKSDEHQQAQAFGCAMLAQLASLCLFIAILSTTSIALMLSMALPLLVAALCLVLAAATGLLNRQKTATQTEFETERVFKLSTALLIAGTIALMLVLGAWLQHIFGSTGVLVAAAFAALAELHAAAASLGQLFASGSLPLPIAQWGLLVILASSAIAKSVLAFAVGGVKYGTRISLGLASMVTGAGLSLLWIG